MAFGLFDLIVYDEGHYELQKVQYKHSNFYDWLKISPKARYQSEGQFDALPKSIEDRYKRWYARESRILHRNRFRQWQKPKTLDNLLTPQDDTPNYEQLYRESQARLAKAEQHLKTLADDSANVGRKMNAIRWAKRGY